VKARMITVTGVYILAISPPLEGGGEKKRHFLEFGEENRPLAKKKISELKLFKIFIEKPFLN
jgi:hypothetical protein